MADRRGALGDRSLDGAAAAAQAAWTALDHPWRVAFEEAWTSWCAGNFGIGAVLTDPAAGVVVSTGRNRVTETAVEPQVLAGNFTAHAEMNAFASMDRMLADGLHLYTTLQPCLMCAGTAIQLNVDEVHYAARDGFFDGLEDLWEHHEFPRTRQPSWNGPLGGRLERFARVLPLSFLLLWVPGGDGAEVAREREPAAVALAKRLPEDPALLAVRARRGLAVDALAALWSRLGD